MRGTGLLAYKLAQATTQPRIACANVKRGDAILDGPYPKSFSEFVGQEQARLQLIAAIGSAYKRGTSVDHILLASGQPGIGKTTLGRLVAHKIQRGFFEVGGTVTEKDMQMVLKQMEDGDVLFLDEVHRLVNRGKAKAEWLLQLLQDGVIVTPRGVVVAPQITVIAATTDAQKLPETILDRFPIKPVLLPYTEAEACRIANTTATRLGFGDLIPMPAQSEWLAGVARACDNNPRRMTQLLVAVRDVALASDNANLSEAEGYDLSTALEWNGLTEDGLSRTSQDYLLVLFAYDGTAGLPSMKAALNEEQLRHTEKQLIQKGFIKVTSRGRELTDLGMDRAMQIAQEEMTA